MIPLGLLAPAFFCAFVAIPAWFLVFTERE